MNSAALLAIGLLSAAFWLTGSARCQTSLAPPSTARPAPDVDAAPPPVIRALPEITEDDPPPSAPAIRRTAPPVAATTIPASKPAADYDGFTTGAENEPVAKLPDLPRSAKRSKAAKELAKEPAKEAAKPAKQPDDIAGQPWVPSAEDESLRRKLSICRNCK